MKGNALSLRPRLWVPAGGGWTLVQLGLGGTDGEVLDVAANGVAVGSTGNRAAVWMPNGTNSWAAPALLGATASELDGVNTAGNLAVGTDGAHAAYWTYSGTAWSGPNVLPGGCTSAAAVDDGGRIVVNDCPKGSRRVPGVIAPPYAAGNVTLLGGLGDNASTTIAEDISRGGVFIVGQSTVRNQPVGVYWRIP